MFAGQLIAEMALPVGADTLLEEFTRWTTGLFPGALELVGRVPQRYTRTTLSNSDALQWPRLMKEMRLGEAFDHHFASHLVGKIKADEEVFHHVTGRLNRPPDEILFLDDNQLNIEAAERVGMKATQVGGVAVPPGTDRRAGWNRRHDETRVRQRKPHSQSPPECLYCWLDCSHRRPN